MDYTTLTLIFSDLLKRVSLRGFFEKSCYKLIANHRYYFETGSKGRKFVENLNFAGISRLTGLNCSALKDQPVPFKLKNNP